MSKDESEEDEESLICVVVFGVEGIVGGINDDDEEEDAELVDEEEDELEASDTETGELRRLWLLLVVDTTKPADDVRSFLVIDGVLGLVGVDCDSNLSLSDRTWFDGVAVVVVVGAVLLMITVSVDEHSDLGDIEADDEDDDDILLLFAGFTENDCWLVLSRLRVSVISWSEPDSWLLASTTTFAAAVAAAAAADCFRRLISERRFFECSRKLST